MTSAQSLPDITPPIEDYLKAIYAVVRESAEGCATTSAIAERVTAREEGSAPPASRGRSSPSPPRLRLAFAATLFAWSTVFWLLLEVVNLRLANWFYVFVPDARAPRWAGTLPPAPPS